MNKLPLTTRIQILTMLCEGSSMRSISRVCGVSINTVTKLLIDAREGEPKKRGPYKKKSAQISN